ncbi:MAG: hypothetical protein KIG81_00280 [Thermoguttaceae bacterium]|nr:hypothetical protein [Thermoguttaceae bacterium]
MYCNAEGAKGETDFADVGSIFFTSRALALGERRMDALRVHVGRRLSSP